ncbi:hypothetical protein QR680_004855 [Steinernema hermaphroditum]|uniref:Cystatin domain-containing protein n=1 Tax=Steinernema hermaphroditum TaxID=289476 RepID=A0AA39HSA0_9BILA|nr:hypothetical protein QR680_004855 [Steinernema hermaphroditum]
MARVVLALLALSVAVALAMPGGVTDMDLNDPKVKDLQWKAIKAINADSGPLNLPNNFVPVKITKATQQIVAGTKHVIELDVAESDCLKTKVNHEQLKSKPCKLKVGGTRGTFKVEIFEALQPKDSTVKILSASAVL